jgi:hypothetical protein
VIPIIRLSTRFDYYLNAWQIPSRKDIVSLANFLSTLRLAPERKNLSLFLMEVNHAAEWGGKN